MSASWRVYKGPPKWSTTDSDRPWTVMHREYVMYDAFSKREWITYSTHPSWGEAIDTVVTAQREIMNEEEI